MTKFKRVDTKNNRVMYFVNGEMSSKTRIPENVLNLLDSNTELDLDVLPLPDQTKPEEPKQEEERPRKTTNYKLCLFRSHNEPVPATHQKLIHEITVGLCDEHYLYTTGKIGQEIKEQELA